MPRPVPGPKTMAPVPVQVAEELLFSVPPKSSFPPAPLRDSAPLAFVTPPLILPPLQLVVLLTSSVPEPPRSPLLNVKLVTLAAALSVQMPPLLITASSPAPGTPLGFQLVAVNQSPEATFQLKLVACARAPVLTTKPRDMTSTVQPGRRLAPPPAGPPAKNLATLDNANLRRSKRTNRRSSWAIETS